MNDWVYFPEYRKVMAPGGWICEVYNPDNGPLLAAAPELLAACKDAMKLWDKGETIDSDQAEVDHLRAAIAKATAGA